MKVDRYEIISKLNDSFSKSIEGIKGPNTKGTNLYKYQVEFCYLIDNIQRGPMCDVPENAAKCNDLIAGICAKEHNYV